MWRERAGWRWQHRSATSCFGGSRGKTESSMHITQLEGLLDPHNGLVDNQAAAAAGDVGPAARNEDTHDVGTGWTLLLLQACSLGP